jgi:hypothetical protein
MIDSILVNVEMKNRDYLKGLGKIERDNPFNLPKSKENV